MAFASWKSGKLTRKVSPWDTSLYLNTDLWVTAGRLFSKNDSQIEFMNFTWKTTISATEYQYTGLTRQLSQTATPATSVWTWFTWLANQEFILDYMHDQIFDAINGWTVAWNMVFNGDVTIAGNSIFGKSIKIPVYADTTARDIGIPTPTNGMEVYITALWAFYDYQSGAWNSRANGATVNATTTVSGKVQRSTIGQMATFPENGSTGAPLILTPFDFSTVYWSGSDGDVTITTNTTLSRDMYYNNLIVNATFILNTGWYKIYVSGTLSWGGIIDWPAGWFWSAWGNGGISNPYSNWWSWPGWNGSGGGWNGWSWGTVSLGWSSSRIAWSASSNINPSFVNANWSSWSGTPAFWTSIRWSQYNTVSPPKYADVLKALWFTCFPQLSNVWWIWPTIAQYGCLPGWSGWASGDRDNGAGSSCGWGGWGGWGGGVVIISAYILSGASLTIRSLGWGWGIWGNAGANAGANAWGGCGWNGWSGWVSFIIYHTLVALPTFTLTGWAGWSPWSTVGTWSVWLTGSVGTTWSSITATF